VGLSVLKITTCLALNTVAITQAIADYLQERLPIPVALVDDIPWPERYHRIDKGEIDVGWICGLPYSQRVDRPQANIALLAAPIMQGARYAGRPCYFSDVVVHQNSPYQSLADLRGATWAYNEPGSLSGYAVTCYYLTKMGQKAGFFGRAVASGAHKKSLQMILDRQVDGSAIDSTVLEWELARRPSIRQQIRIIDSLGPNPIPPWVILKSVPSPIRQQLQRLLLHLHHDARGRAILALGHLARFTAVQDKAYDTVRHIAQAAESMTL
jgi:phosphonate transport system substrate-binding protein